MRTNVLQKNLIDDKLKMIEAQRLEISVDDYELNNYVETIFGISSENLRNLNNI